MLATPVCITVSSMSETTTNRAASRRDVDLGRGRDPRRRQHRELEAVPAPVARHRPARRHLDAEIAVAVGLDLALGPVEARADAGAAHRPAADPAQDVAHLRLDGRLAVGALPEGAADHEDPLGRAVAAIGLQHHAARAARRCAPAAPAPAAGRGGPSRARRQAASGRVGGRQRGVDRRHHRRALADRAADALDRSRRARRRSRRRPAGSPRAAACPASAPGTAAPVSTNPERSSFSAQGRTQLVSGSAPTKRNRLRIGRVAARAVRRQPQVRPSRCRAGSPSSAVISVLGRRARCSASPRSARRGSATCSC